MVGSVVGSEVGSEGVKEWGWGSVDSPVWRGSHS